MGRNKIKRQELQELNMLKIDYIRDAVNDKNGRFALVFQGVCKTLKGMRLVKIGTEDMLGMAIQVYYMRGSKGTYECLTYWGMQQQDNGRHDKNKDVLEFDPGVLLNMKPETLRENVRLYQEIKQEFGGHARV